MVREGPLPLTAGLALCLARTSRAVPVLSGFPLIERSLSCEALLEHRLRFLPPFASSCFAARRLSRLHRGLYPPAKAVREAFSYKLHRPARCRRVTSIYRAHFASDAQALLPDCAQKR